MFIPLSTAQSNLSSARYTLRTWEVGGAIRRLDLFDQIEGAPSGDYEQIGSLAVTNDYVHKPSVDYFLARADG